MINIQCTHYHAVLLLLSSISNVHMLWLKVWREKRGKNHLVVSVASPKT